MPKPTLPMPDDFRVYASIEGNLKLRKRYSVGGATIERWRAQIGARYNLPTMPKRIPIAVKKRAGRRWRMREAIEDLDDFDIDDVVRSLGISGYVDEW